MIDAAPMLVCTHVDLFRGRDAVIVVAVASSIEAHHNTGATAMARILVVDDEAAHRESLRRIFERAGHEVTLAKDGDEAVALIEQVAVDVVLTDLVMPRTDGRAVLAAARRLRPTADVVLMTAYGNVENAVAAMRDGAKDFLTKPTRRGELLACIQRLLERQALLAENRALRAELKAQPDGRQREVRGVEVRGVERLLGQSAPLLELKQTLAQVGRTSATVLLVGEAGTGKELCARVLHEQSARASGPFIAVNCGALPDSVLEAELFGAEGTHGDEPRLGRFERAHGGTLLIDEVQALPLPLQVKVLRALHDGEIERLGGTVAHKVDVRVVAATDVDLQGLVAAGRFRDDLYSRLDVVSLRLPPLRERDGDVALLASAWLAVHSARHGRVIAGFEPLALHALTSWGYPGNVRELSHAVERAVVLCPDGAAIRFEDLPTAIKLGARADGGNEIVDGVMAAVDVATLQFRVGQMTLPQLERAAIDATMAFVAGDKVQAAKLLGVSLRTLYRRLDEKPGVEADDD